jgi:hypothetical protein
MRNLDRNATIKPAAKPDALVEVRGASGRLYGRLNPETLVIEFRRGKDVEQVDLSRYQNAAKQ